MNCLTTLFITKPEARDPMRKLIAALSLLTLTSTVGCDEQMAMQPRSFEVPTVNQGSPQNFPEPAACLRKWGPFVTCPPPMHKPACDPNKPACE